MQLLKAMTLTAAMLPAALAKIDPLPTSTDAESYLSDHPSLSTVATGTQATSLVSAIYSVEKSWRDEAMYTTMYSHMWSAAAKATNSPDVVASLAVTGWSYWDTTEQSWWKDDMPEKENKFVSEYMSDWESAYQKVMATATGTGSKGAAPRCTGMAMAGVAAGVAAGVIIAI
ncbi:hypothetical protein CKAH01_05369 [Colletotrichum kahawae]|uniref:Uncharacterized protein n=1 Tax=Colletotrichum kahawae TaxID=34407 RepID=A0AAD9YDB0_COLKA|nr:hypothetical protein CKAH01_05369 [Colletotrichum kahawae]